MQRISKHRWFLCCAFAVTVSAMMGLGCAQSSQRCETTAKDDSARTPEVAALLRDQAADSKPPVVCIEHLSGRRAGDRNGLEVAVWKDGLVVFAPDRDMPGTALRVGSVSPEQVSHLLTQLKDAGFFDIESSSYLVPDGGKIAISARHEGEVRRHEWDEVLRLGHGANKLVPSKAYRRFKHIWSGAREAIAACRPSESVPVQKLAEQSERIRRVVKPAVKM